MSEAYINHRRHCRIKSDRCEGCYTLRQFAVRDLHELEDSVQAQRMTLKPTEELQTHLLEALLICSKVRVWCKTYILSGTVLTPSDDGMKLDYRSLDDMEHAMKGIWDAKRGLNKQTVVYRLQLTEAQTVVLERQYNETKIVLDRLEKEIKDAERAILERRNHLAAA